ICTLTEIPLFDRNHQELVQLLPGVTPPRTSNSFLLDPQRNRIWETNGMPNQFNRRILDGVENDEPNQSLSVYLSPVESVQQADPHLPIIRFQQTVFRRSRGTCSPSSPPPTRKVSKTT